MSTIVTLASLIAGGSGIASYAPLLRRLSLSRRRRVGAAVARRALLAALRCRCRRGLRLSQLREQIGLLRLELVQVRLQRLSGERRSRRAQEASGHHAGDLLVGQLAIGQVDDLAAVGIAVQLLATTQRDRAVDDVLTHVAHTPRCYFTLCRIVVTDTASRESRNPADGPSLSSRQAACRLSDGGRDQIGAVRADELLGLVDRHFVEGLRRALFPPGADTEAATHAERQAERQAVEARVRI